MSEDKKEKNLLLAANFVQIDRESMKSLRELAEQSPTKFKILMVMAEKMDQNSAVKKIIKDIYGRSPVV